MDKSLQLLSFLENQMAAHRVRVPEAKRRKGNRKDSLPPESDAHNSEHHWGMDGQTAESAKVSIMGVSREGTTGMNDRLIG